mmetsp:Transcript_79828/g.258674  ORF Transcript_79828/g.258674 Transcript_79828/m.258674 type:complete len:85 (+) Transcript_79828:280-534(+)
MDADQFGELCGDMEQSGIRCEFGAAAAPRKRKVEAILIDDSDGEPAVSQCDVGDSRPGLQVVPNWRESCMWILISDSCVSMRGL